VDHLLPAFLHPLPHRGLCLRQAVLGKILRGDTFVTVRSVDTLVKRLRHRIEADPASPRYLCTVWGVGYRFLDAVPGSL
jgi:two-component system response regulator ResD